MLEEYREIFINKEFKDLLKFFIDDDDDVEDLEEVELLIWRFEKFGVVF